MSGRQFVRIELLAARGLRALGVEAGKSLRGNLFLGCIFVGRERGVLFRGRYMPVRYRRCRSIVWQRRLSTGGNKFRSLGDDRGLGAGRKQSPSQGDSKRPDDAPHGRGRDEGRVETNTVRSNVDARNSGTNGIHVASPTRAPKPNSSRMQWRDPIRAEPWPEETSTTRFHFSVIIEPQLAKQPVGRIGAA